MAVESAVHFRAGRMVENCVSHRPGDATQFIPHVELDGTHPSGVRKSLEQQLGAFLRRQRGDATYAQFARKLGVSQSTLFRLEQGRRCVEQSMGTRQSRRNSRCNAGSTHRCQY